MAIGKKIGKDNIYIHKSAVSNLPEHLRQRLDKALAAVFRRVLAKNEHDRWIRLNFVITHPNHIEIVEAEDFDSTWEPVLGQRYRVTDDGEVTHIPRPAKPRILHQRYKTVDPEHYFGFDIENDKDRERWYRSHFDAKRMAGAGFLHKWKEMLSELDK